MHNKHGSQKCRYIQNTGRSKADQVVLKRADSQPLIPLFVIVIEQDVLQKFRKRKIFNQLCLLDPRQISKKNSS